MATNDVLDRLEALLDKATMGPWETEDVVVPPSKLAMEKMPDLGEQVAHLICTTWIHGQAKAKIRIVKQWYSPYTEPKDWHSFTRDDAALIAALRNAAPALIRLARAVLAVDDWTTKTDYEMKLACNEKSDAIKALGEVRL